ncbi:MAG: efflux RND transporter periplasmic adaptor subunit [Acidobacteria bacterium]|nr:MAG: efflux RND transporter periplasmic adaptor subunit [Acidobacteriota bacterium]
MRTMLKAATATLTLALAVSGCSKSGEGKDAVGGKPAVAVEVASVAPTTLTQAIDVVGTLEPKYFADVKSEFTAVVTEVYVTQWVHVDKGAPLARLDTRDADAARRATTAMALQADVAATRANRELERAVKLKDHGLLTQQALDDARSAAEVAAAAAQAAAAELTAAETRLAKAVIRAPMAGTVALRSVNIGDRVENMGSGDPMFRIVDNRVLDLTVSVPSARSAAVAVGQKLDFTVDAYPGKTFSGRVSHINPAADAASRTVRLMVEVPNEGGELRGGTFVKGRIATGERTGVLQIPRAALLSWDVEHGTGEVFVVDGDVAQRRTVKTGETTADNVEVVEGLAAGEKVIVRGGFNLRPGDRVQVAALQGA